MIERQTGGLHEVIKNLYKLQNLWQISYSPDEKMIELNIVLRMSREIG
jgi:hypothetical protein